MRITMKQAEISAAIALYIASKGLVMPADASLDITFSITRNPTSVTAEFEVPDLAPVALSLEQVTKAEANENSLAVGQVNETGPGLEQAEPQTDAEQAQALDDHQSGGTATVEPEPVNLGQASSETTALFTPAADAAGDLNAALATPEVAAAVADVAPVVAAVGESEVETLPWQGAQEAEQTATATEVETEAPVVDTKSLFG